MPTKPESTAAATAAVEAEAWADLADDLAPMPVGRLSEHDVIPQVDPTDDLVRRGRRWSHEFPTAGLADLCRFAAGLATVEAAAWTDRDAIVATRAHEDRRFLFGDRIVHWAAPALIAAGTDASFLLDLGDRMRPAPPESTGEGLVLPGHDLYGPADEPVGLEDRLLSLWGGAAPGIEVDDVAGHYDSAADRWHKLADRHTGTAALWSALAHRAEITRDLARVRDPR